MVWQQVFEHEVARRRLIAQNNPKLFRQMHVMNPKRLGLQKACKSHVWVPASHLMIHDKTAKAVVIGGVKIRAFTEAKAFSRHNLTIVPQMCWYCDANRELEIENLSAAERKAQFTAINKRARKMGSRGIIEPLDLDFSDL